MIRFLLWFGAFMYAVLVADSAYRSGDFIWIPLTAIAVVSAVNAFRSVHHFFEGLK